VTPPLSTATRDKIALRDRKFGGNTGGKVLERLIPEITPGAFPVFTLFVATPKGEASKGEMATKNHPVGVRESGEIRG
jgi:hypothetical protein